MQFFKIRNWENFQHYKDRNPPWIKLYNSLLEDYEFSMLSDNSKLHIMLIWMLASRSDNKLPFDADWIKNKIGSKSKVDLSELLLHRYIEKITNENNNLDDASIVLDDCKQLAMPETETETETETENKKQETLKIPYQLIADAYNDHFAKKTGNASVKSDSLSDKRKKAIKRMWLSEKTFQELDSWIKYFSHCADLPNMQFDAPRSEKWATWKPSFDYLLKQDTLEKAREGRL